MPIMLQGAHGFGFGGTNERVHLDMDAVDDFPRRHIDGVTLGVLRTECETGRVI